MKRAAKAQSSGLAEYQSRRDFTRTPEPAAGGGPSGTGRRFVVQRHRARALHYDFRLEIDGVLVSWAVPKGPTLDPGVRRAAIHVEDHPLSYYDFEGVIPAGQYGGGDVIVWDAGTWQPYPADADPARELEAGTLHLDLAGEKLKGRFVLVLTKKEAAKKEQWLLFHKHDEQAVEGWDPEDHPASVLSGRTNEEVKAHPERVWQSNRGPVGEALDALGQLGGAGRWEAFGREVAVTNLDKVLFSGSGSEPAVTKRELLEYAARIAPVVLPYLTGRAINLHRYPDGEATPGFWQRHLPAHAPGWLERWASPDGGTSLVISEPAALLWAVNNGGVEWHAWTSATGAPDLPGYALIDLDPGEGTSWEDVLVLARLHRTALEHLGLSACAKTTGRRGIQIWVPIAPGPTFDEVRAWVAQLSTAVGAVVPELVSWQWQREDRAGRARLDYTQNAQHKTLVAPYSPRAVTGVTVSAPITWAELDDPHLDPGLFTIRTMPGRVEAAGDLFRPVQRHDQQLPEL
ncbi:non-homologous end-joining DNA ligase [Longispora albida]|uniref:non-homologous end-joining DNA ligase n=1 Tax=Longispora albida TaxID=203523 RepID=UPI000368B1C6|nr:non-homologous end-joining DNA ligase [Longispora albida]